jgi:hypothetical protein
LFLGDDADEGFVHRSDDHVGNAERSENRAHVEAFVHTATPLRGQMAAELANALEKAIDGGQLTTKAERLTAMQVLDI